MSQRRRPRRTGGRRAAPADSLRGTTFELEIDDVAAGGQCVGRHEGRVVFVRHTLPGERVVARVTDGTATSRFLRADAVEVLRASEHRTSSRCAVSGPGGCGGCDWQHTTAAYNRELKARVVRDQLRRIAGLDLPVEVAPVPGDEDGLRWRTRSEFVAGDTGRAAMRQHRSHRTIEIDDCPITTSAVSESGVFASRLPAPAVDVVASSTGQVEIVPLPVREDPPLITEQVRSPDGSRWNLEVSARGFWQVHPGAASTFVERVLALTDPQPGERVADLYSGVGLFSVAFADRVGPSGAVIAVEGDREAVEHARANTAATGWVESYDADVRQAVEQGPLHRAAEIGMDVVVLDPPRTGAGREVMAAVTGWGPRAICYVACDPAALARDIGYARDHGYQVMALEGYDAFPMTHHVECIALLAHS